MIPEHGVQQGQEFSHAGDDDDLALFSGLLQTLCENSDQRIESDGGQRGHVEHGADRGPSTADGALALKLSGVVVEGRDADQRRDLPAVGGAQFAELGQEGGAEDCADAGDGLEEFVDGVEVVIGLDQFPDLFVEGFDLDVDGLLNRVDGLERRLAGGAFAAVGLLGADVGELASAGARATTSRRANDAPAAPTTATIGSSGR